MPVTDVEGCDGLYVIDTLMFGLEEQTAAFLIDGEDVMLVDAGLPGDADVVLEALDTVGVGGGELDYVLVTHVHLDHAGGVSYVLDEYDAEVLTHPNSVEYLTQSEKLGNLMESTRRAMGALADQYGEPQTVPVSRVREVRDGDVIDLGSHKLEVLHTPGHAPHHVSLYEQESNALFVVDEGCVYMNGELLPTTPPSDFDLDKTLESLDRFMQLDPGVLLYGHFGVNYDGAEALPRHVEVLKEWVDVIRGSWEEHCDWDEVVDDVVAGYEDRMELGLMEREILKRDVIGVLIYLEGKS